jgi:hypothetical protein
MATRLDESIGDFERPEEDVPWFDDQRERVDPLFPWGKRHVRVVA